MKVVAYAETHTNAAAEREYDINEKLIRDWRSKKVALATVKKTAKKIRHNPSPVAKLEVDLNTWVLDLRSQGYVVTRSAIRLQALTMAKKTDYETPTDFKASAGWCTRFMKRYGLTLRQRTHIAQKLPADVEHKVANFHQFVLKERKSHNYPLIAIGNMDETPMTFDLPSNRTVDSKGSKTINIKTCGAEKSHFTVVLACLADGTKLKPMVIFKRKTKPKEKLPSGVFVECNKKGWMDESFVNLWVDEIWGKRPGALLHKKSLLVWDMFRAHLVDSVQKNLLRRKTHKAVIPGGCTSLLQPLDVSLNKPFKTKMRALWTEWMISGPKEYTAGGNQRRASYQQACEWTITAWDSISKETVIKSFKKCGISNAMDGSEDDALYDDLINSSDNNTTTTTAEVETEEDSELDEMYDDMPLSDLQMQLLFQEDSDDDEEFFGFGPQESRE